MKTYGLIHVREHLLGSAWSSQLTFVPQRGESVQLVVAEAPASDSGRSLCSFAQSISQENAFPRWLDFYRSNAAAKLSPAHFFRANALVPLAHLIRSVGKEPILLLLGGEAAAFPSAMEVLPQGSTATGFAEEVLFPAIALTKQPFEGGWSLTATADTPAELFWEATGGLLDRRRTLSGEPNRISGGNLSGVRVKLGFKYFSGVTETTL